jgi:hypothetical protein
MEEPINQARLLPVRGIKEAHMRHEREYRAKAHAAYELAHYYDNLASAEAAMVRYLECTFAASPELPERFPRDGVQPLPPVRSMTELRERVPGFGKSDPKPPDAA